MYAVQYSHEVGVYTMAKSDWHSCGTMPVSCLCYYTPVHCTRLLLWQQQYYRV